MHVYAVFGCLRGQIVVERRGDSNVWSWFNIFESVGWCTRPKKCWPGGFTFPSKLFAIYRFRMWRFICLALLPHSCCDWSTTSCQKRVAGKVTAKEKLGSVWMRSKAIAAERCRCDAALSCSRVRGGGRRGSCCDCFPPIAAQVPFGGAEMSVINRCTWGKGLLLEWRRKIASIVVKRHVSDIHGLFSCPRFVVIPTHGQREVVL